MATENVFHHGNGRNLGTGLSARSGAVVEVWQRSR